MRFIPTHYLIEGMLLGEKIYNQASGILLEKGVSLTPSYIERIKTLGYNGVYIIDHISEDINVQEILKAEFKQKVVNQLKDIYNKVEQSADKPIEVDNLVESAEAIVDEVLSNKDLIVNMIDLKIFDDYTFYHCLNVALLSTIVGASYKLNRKQLKELCLSGLLHDIGKMFLSKDILLKPGRLTLDEFQVVKDHCINGHNYLKDVYDVPAAVKNAVLDHHERWDGEGYPENKQRNEISLFGRIITVADVYDALTSDRPYRKAELPSEAMEYILGGGGTMFDAEVVKHFSKKIAPYPVGTCVSLSDGKVGIVVENYPDCCIRPKIKILSHFGHVIAPYEISLKNDAEYINTTITGIVNI